MKTESGDRVDYLSKTVGEALLKYKEEQDLEKKAAREKYHDYDLVIAQPDGSPYEERLMLKKFKEYLKQNGYPEVVFHSLRHLSTQIKLKASSGDIKAVQKETGHASPKMVMEQYSNSYIPNKQKMADEVEKMFFSSQTEKEEEETMKIAISYLEKNPELADMIANLAMRPH